MYISVIGSSECDGSLGELAYQVGREIAGKGHVLVCGGLGGVMEEAARGASEADGLSIGILPGYDRSCENRWLSVSVVTEMYHARNAIVARSGDALIAVGGGYGTLSEIAFGLKMGKPVVGLKTWDIGRIDSGPGRFVPVGSPREAVLTAERLAETRGDL